MIITIKQSSRDGSDPSIARAVGLGVTASCTMGIQIAVERCAEKVAKGRPFTLKKSGPRTWSCEISKNSSRVREVGKPNTQEDAVKNAAKVIVRTQSAGVFYGTLSARSGSELTLKNARRIWYWKGAASLSEMAMKGVSRPAECKFPMAVAEIMLIGVIEILGTTEEAQKSIEGVPVWTGR